MEKNTIKKENRSNNNIFLMEKNIKNLKISLKI